MKSILKLSFITSLIFCVQLAFGQSEMSAETTSDKVTEDREEVPQIFKDYTWLKDIVNPEDCKGASLSLRTDSAKSHHKYIVVTTDGKKVMYNAKGEQYCIDHSSLNCQEFYKLNKELDTWTCN